MGCLLTGSGCATDSGAAGACAGLANQGSSCVPVRCGAEAPAVAAAGAPPLLLEASPAGFGARKLCRVGAALPAATAETRRLRGAGRMALAQRVGG